MRKRAFIMLSLVVVQLWLAHGIGYFMHEYAHSFFAWFLHDKANPLALDYGHLSLDNVLFQSDIDENVDYAPLFAAGRGALVSLIAVSGVLVGNGLSYILSRLLYAKAKQKNRPRWAMLFFWIGVMSVGNFLSYVPVRTFTTHADMATTAQGLNVSPWVIAVVLGLPFALAVWHFLANWLPDAETFLFSDAPRTQGTVVLLTTYIIFVFFGSSGISRYGNISHWISMFSVFILFPLITIICLLPDRET
jgi:hypothetical protein